LSLSSVAAKYLLTHSSSLYEIESRVDYNHVYMDTTLCIICLHAENNKNGKEWKLKLSMNIFIETVDSYSLLNLLHAGSMVSSS
jgi:hypothetical protein